MTKNEEIYQEVHRRALSDSQIHALQVLRDSERVAINRGSTTAEDSVVYQKSIVNLFLQVNDFKERARTLYNAGKMLDAADKNYIADSIERDLFAICYG